MSYGSSTYAVYHVTLPGGAVISMGWRLPATEYAAYGVHASSFRHMTQASFKALQVFGNVSEITQRGDTQHPFTQYLQKLEGLYGTVSWLHDKQFMGTMLSGWAENTSPTELTQKLTQTTWYQNHTSTQRSWESLGTADRTSQINATKTQMQEQLQGIYGPTGSGFDKYVNDQNLTKWATDVASGVYGAPSDGMNIWLQARTKEAAKISGTLAWTDQEKTLENQRAFMNRPEDQLLALQQDAQAWLGPNAMPDAGTLQKWANNLVSGTNSQADWTDFMQQRAKALYPWLGPNEKWQDRASSYKNIAEQAWDTQLAWNDPVLQKIGQNDPKTGAPTGAANSFDQFSQQVRSDPRFWTSNTGRQAGFDVLAQLDSTFKGM